MKLYIEYIKETANRDCIYNEEGFITYYITGKVINIEDFFIKKEYRGNDKKRWYYDKVCETGKELNCTHCASVINKHSSEITQNRTRHILESEGFEQYEEDDYMIYFIKEIL